MLKHSIAIAALCIATAPPAAWAGRPLSTDDAGTAEPGTCQVEGWGERAGAERALVLAPACGIAEGLELDADYTRPHPRDELRGAAGLALKWAPAAARIESSAGELAFGLKLSHAFEHPAGAGWRSAESGALALASWSVAETWTLHANLGAAHQRASGRSAALLNLAAVWAPTDQVLLFAETQANNRREDFGGTVNSVGARWWLVPDRFGLDLSASREAGVGGPTLWTFGFGWYGLGL